MQVTAYPTASPALLNAIATDAQNYAAKLYSYVGTWLNQAAIAEDSADRELCVYMAICAQNDARTAYAAARHAAI